MRNATPPLTLALALSALAGCGHDFEPPDRGERVREAAAVYAPGLFDSLTWASDSVRALEGNGVYAQKCRRCHGPLGRGQTTYAAERHLDVPSLVEADWPLATMDSLHKHVFIGHEEGMAGFGIAGITPREIDSSAYYILNVLRPEVLEGENR